MPLKNKVLVIGNTKDSERVFKHLETENLVFYLTDKPVTLTNFNGIKIEGDLKDLSSLEENGIKSTSKVFISTNDNELNIFLTIASVKLYKIKNVITILNDEELSPLIDTLPGVKVISNVNDVLGGSLWNF